MKILYIANIRLPTEKAHGIQIMKMCEAFARAGHDVELVVPTRRTPITEDAFVYYGVARTFDIKRLSTIDIAIRGRFSFWLQMFAWIVASVRYVRHTQADIVYSRDPALFFFGKFSTRKKCILEVHTKPAIRLMRRIRKLQIDIIVITNGLKDMLVSGGISKKRILVAHDGVDSNEFVESYGTKKKLRELLTLPQSANIIAYVGKLQTMGKSKGVEQLITAFGIVHASQSSAHLLLVGLNDDEFEAVKSLMQNASIPTDAYTLVGHVTHEHVPKYLAASDVLVMNYPNTEHYARCMSPMKLFEYMASKRPIIATRLPSIEEVLNEKNAILVEPDNPESLADVIQNMPHDATNRAEQAFHDVQQYTWDKRAESILSLIS